MRLFLSVTILSALVVGCGGGKGGGGGGDDDVVIDAPDVPPPPDAPAALSGLGQVCQVAMQGADCPTTAPGCLQFDAAATTGICTNVCQMANSFMTDAQSQPKNLPSGMANDGVCAGIYTGGTEGVPKCDIIVNLNPADNPLKPNKTYTFDYVCGIDCGAGNTCPGGLTCDTTQMTCH